LTPNPYLGSDAEKLVRFADSLGIRFYINSGLMTPREETGRVEGFRDIGIDEYIRLFKLQMALKGELPPPECAQDLPNPGGDAAQAPRGLRCGGGRSSFNVTWEGELIPCNRLCHLSAKPLDFGFAEAWQIVHKHAMEYLLPRECESCPYKPAASPCAAKHEENPGHADLRQCEYCRALVKAGIVKIQ